MKKLKKWLIPVLLLSIICIELFDYYTENKINTALWGLGVLSIPKALKGFEINVSKYLEWLLNIIALLLIIYAVFSIIW